MSFVSVDFYGARAMAGEIEDMGKTCAALAGETGLAALEALAGDLAGIAADVRRACEKREKLDGELLYGLRPDYGEVLK